MILTILFKIPLTYGEHCSSHLLRFTRLADYRDYCKTLIISAHLIFVKFANSLKSRN